MTKDQRIVAAGVFSGVASMALAVYVLDHVLPSPAGISTRADQLAYALRVDVLAVVPLFVMIANVSNARFMGKAIDPLAHEESTRMEIDGRVVDNTLQQTFVFLVGTTALSAALSPEHLQLLLALAIVFVVARVAFWVGYRMHPLYRAPGMAATSYMNLGILLTVLYRWAF